MNNFKKGSVIVVTLVLLALMCQSVGYSAQISRSVIYDATIVPFGKIDKEIVFPENHDPFYLHLSFLLSPGTITADLNGAVIFDQNNGTILLQGSRGNLSTGGGINFKGSIEMDFVIPVDFYTLLFAMPSLALVDLVFDLPDIEIPVDGTVTVFDLGPHWRESKSFNSFLLNGESVKVTAGVRDILSKKLSAVDLAGYIVTATTGIPPIAVDIAEDVIKIGLGDSRISLNAGLTSNLTLSGEAIIVNGQRVVREGQSIAAPGLDLSRNSYEIHTTYVENFTTVLDLLFSADIELMFNPLGIEMWEYDEPIAELPINVVPERTRELEFKTTPETVVFPIEQTSVNRSPQPEGSINIRPLTVGGSAARGDVSPYFSDPDNDRLTYRAQSDNTNVAEASVSDSEVTITPGREGSTTITITATDPGGLTATQTIDVTVQAEHRCEYTLSQSSLDVPASGGPLQVDVTTTSGCDWNATTTSDFLSVSPSSGTGGGTVSVTVDANTRTRSRSGRLTIAGKTFTVNQDGVRRIASQDLSRGDAIIVQNTLNLGLNIRSEARIPPPPEDRNSNRIGKVFDGATGEITGGPRRADGFKWWKVDWDNAPTGWSVEAIDEHLLIIHRPPDLAIESFEVSKDRLDPGEEFTLSLTVRNVGYNSSEETDLYYYHTSTRALTSTDDLKMVGTDTVRGLDPNRTSDESIRVKAPLTPGTYYYAAALINDGSDPNIVNNFVPSKERVTVSRPTFPDFVVSFSVNEDTLAPRERFTLSATVRNRGAGASRSTKLRYYRSSDSTISTDDTQVETDGVNSLDPDETDDESAIINAPNQTGVYYYGACVDSVRNERDTDNNCSNGVRITVSGSSGSPDLLIGNVEVSDSILTSGSSFRVSATVRNRSADSSDSTRLRYYRSTDSTISTDDTEVGTDGVGSISGDGTRDESKTLTAPSEVGTYYYGACVDSVRGESKTGNNCSDGIPVVVRAPQNQAPEAVGTLPPQTLTEGGSAANVGVSHNFDDPDNDSLTYTAISDNTSVATASVSDALVTITPESVGSATVTVIASDGTLTATQDITVTVEAAPRTVQTLAKISGDNQQGVPGATLTSPFVVEVWDAAGNPLEGIIVTFAVTAGGGSLSAQTTTTDASGQASTRLTLGPNAGTNTVEASVSVIAMSLRFTAAAQEASGHAPEPVGSVSAQTLTVGGSAASINVSGNFRDPENDSLTYTATSDNTGVATVNVSGAVVTITPESVGSATVTVTASDGTLTATQRIAVTVEAAPQRNQAPVSVNTIPAQTLTVGGSAASINVSGNFRDPENDSLTYTATSDNTGVATISVSGAVMTIAPRSVGSATVTVTASDGTLTATQRMTVTVEAAPRVAHTLVKISGDNQQGSPGKTLLNLFVVEVRDAENRGLEDVNVTFTVTGGGGSLSETKVTTGANGQASSRLTLGNNDGEYTVRVSVEGISQAVTFNAIAANEIHIPDRHLRAKIERALNKRAGDPITAADMTTLTSLNARDSNIGDLTGLNFAINLTYLNLYDNNIKILPTGVFVGLSKVTELDLRRNPLTTIKAGAFAGLSNLTKLDLEYSNISKGYLTTIEPGAFEGLSNLTWLSLEGNKLKTLPTGVFEGLSRVTFLDLDDNPLTTIKAGAFKGLSNLTELDLEYSNISKGYLTTIEPGAFEGLSKLTALNMHNNKIAILPTGVFEGLSKVTSLNLKRNPLTTIKAGAFNGLSNLTKLDLEYRNISKGYLTTIEPGAFKGLSKLTALNLHNNKITILPTGVFEGLSKVTSLNLKRNPLTTIKAGAFNGLSNLTKLDLEYRNISKGHLTTIEPGAFKGLSNLTWLSLEGNKLKTLPTGAFEGLSRVAFLDLNDNPLTTIEAGAFNGLSNLTKLDLHNNKITILPTGVFKGLDSLTSLNLNRNPGTPFTLTLKLVRTDSTDLAAPGPATVVVQLAQGAPFEMTVNLSVEGGTLSATTATIARGKIRSDPITITQSGARPATVGLETVPRVPSNYFGLRLAVGNSLSTGSIPIAAQQASNHAPEPVGSISAQTLTVGGIAASIDVPGNFRDPDNDNLNYTATSDNTGVASISVSGAVVTITPESVGSATVTVTASDGTLTATQRMTVTVEAAPRVAHTLVKNSGDNQQGVPGAALPSPFIVEVRDAENRGLEDVDVTFTVTGGGGSLSETKVTTGANGQASSRLTLGNNDGEYTVRVGVEGISQTVTFNAVGVNEIHIPDRHLRAKIERALNKRAGDPITAADMTTLTSLNARYSNIGDLTGLKFATELTRLDLEGNSLTILPMSVFEGLSKVTSLDLNRNPLETIERGAFNGLNSLNSLILDYHPLTTIEGGAFNGLSNVTKLDLEGNRLTILPTGMFAGLSKVTSLNLNRNPLTTIKVNAFKGLDSLQRLVLDYHSLTTIEGGAFNGLSNLTSLDLEGNRLATLPTRVFEGLSKVTLLNLNRNPLTTIKVNAFKGLDSLQKLVLDYHSLTTIEGGAFNGLSNLTSLDLEGNKLKTLPTGMFAGLSKVTSLNLNSNPLETIERRAFNGLNNLEKLVLDYHSLTTIEGGAFDGLSNLTSLDLEGNKLKTLPTGMFAGLSKVTSLNLNSNPLETIKADAFKGLGSLRVLVLDYHSLTTIEGGAFNGLFNLTKLDLEGNRLTTLPTGVFEGLSNLKTLNLNSNPGAPFTLKLELARTDTTDHAAPGPATVVVRLAQGAPFEMTVNLSVEGGTLSAPTATIARGKIQSDPITITQSGARPATVGLETVPKVPSNYFGIRLAVSNSLSTGSIPIPEDVNKDDVVDDQDLALVASHLGEEGVDLPADVNGDGVVDLHDLALVAEAFRNAAAPSSNPEALAMLTAADVRQWLAQAQQLNLADATSQRGIVFLEQLLAALTPKETALLPNYPNPFNPETWIPYRLSKDAQVILAIFDVNGSVIRTFNLGYQPAAVYESREKAIYWNGRNDLGEPVTSGLYFYTLTAGDYVATRKMLIGK